MGLFDRFRKQTEQIQTKEAPRVMFNKIQAYQGKNNRKYKDYAKEGYQENAIVYKCVSMIANNASAVKMKVFAGDNELENHPLISLLERPNPLQSGVEYFHSLISYLLISGNSYMIKDKDISAPTELYLLRPDRIHIKTGTSMIPEAYQYKIDNKVINSYEVNPLTGYSQLKHIKLWNPLDDFYGLSPIVASAYNIDQHNMAGLHNVALLKNGCTPSAMLKFQPKDETGASATLTDDQRAMLLQDLETRFSSSTNAGRPMLLEGDFDYVQMGLNPKDMDFLELMNMSAREIALCFGVPAQLVGIADQTYANVAEARLSLYEETIIPLLDRLESDLNEYLAPLYEGDLSIRYDIDSIPAMAEKRKQIFANVSQGVQQGILTRNEARDRLGLEPIDGGDSLLVPSNLFPLGEVDDTPDDEDNDMPVDAEGNEKYDDTYEMLYGEKAMLEEDVFDNEEEALDRAKVIGCEGTHSMDKDGQTVYMPCSTHAEYDELVGEKALDDLDLTATEGMKTEARRGLDWRKKFNRGGTQVGVARANQIVSGERMSPDTVLRMFSFFSRHEVDKQGQGFKPSQKGYPSAGRIAWALWGGDAGFSWSRQKRNQIMAEREKSYDDLETKVAGLSKTVEKALQGKVDKHNEKHGDKKGKRVTVGMLGKVFKRGVGAYRTNPSSVRPSVRSEDQWAYARVNAFLVAVRTGKFRSGKFDLDLLPKDHPLSSKE
jgi:HK97 family phage portal protein